MNIHGPWIVVAWSSGVVAAAAATWVACRWWYGRKLRAAAHRLDKSDKGRHFSQQQALQARRQVEELKGELAAHRQAAIDSDKARERTRELEGALVAAERSSVVAAVAAPAPAASGFADTQIMQQ